MGLPSSVRHPIIVSAILGGYLAGNIIFRQRAKDASQSRINNATQLLTVAAFLSLIYVLHYHGGGREAWPTILPLACVQVIGQVIYLLVKRLSPSKTVESIDSTVTYASTIMVVMISLYAIFPGGRRWVRHIGVILCIMCGLPLLYALPTLLRASPVEKDIMLDAVRLSQLVYARQKSDAFRDVQFFHDQGTGVRCGVYEDTKNARIYVAFAGSDSKVDWIKTNLDSETESYTFADCVSESAKAVVHKGFLDAWKSIRDPVWKAVSNIMLRQGGSGRLIICGHSLGGAMACVAGPDLACLSEPKYRESLTVVTLGAPKVGNQAFRGVFDSLIRQSVRVTTVYDPITKVSINDFVHIGRYDVTVLGPAETIVTAHDIANYKKALEEKN